MCRGRFGRAAVLWGTLAIFSDALVTAPLRNDIADTIDPKELSAVFAELDSNNDGNLTLHDLDAFSRLVRTRIFKKDIRVMTDMMDRTDTDKDGKINSDELWAVMVQQADGEQKNLLKGESARSAMETAKFKAADMNGNNLLELSELPGLFYAEADDKELEASAKEGIAHKDKNGDGKLSSEEFWEYDEKNPPSAEAKKEDEEDFKRMDSNGDNFMDLTELKGWERALYHTSNSLKQLFGIADSDSDGHVNLEELQNARRKIAEYLHQPHQHVEL